ncbi:MAG TPA: sigma-70 family RNA polymerase sigma factor [Vicinamibacterales bacterium]|nr:sigma-70 family RNA polymerase sigma factor [Vicinamibacterales bacterium]
MLEPNDDVDLVARCLKGDPAAFEPLVTRYERVLFSVALRLVGNYEDARDATQNAFVRAYEHLETFDPTRKFFSWIYRIVVNECLNLRRARRPQEPLADTLEAKDDARDVVEAAEQSRQIDAALLKLTPEYREVVVLRHFLEFSYEEIADVLDLPEKTVKSRLFSARQRLGEILGPGEP